MKEDLIRLKNSFDTGKRYSQYIGGEGSIFDSLSKEQIISRDDSEKVVVYVEELFEKAICNLSSNNILFNKVSVNPVFSIFVDDDFLDENGEIWIDSDETGHCRLLVDDRIPLTKEALVKMFDEKTDYALDYALEYFEYK